MFNKNQRFQLSPRLRLGVGRRFSKNSILKYTGSFFVLVTVLLSINTFRLILDSSNTTQTTNKPQVLGISDTREIATQSQAQFDTYTARKGDTLFSIAQEHDVSWTTLATLNSINSPFTVSVGQELKVPKP